MSHRRVSHGPPPASWTSRLPGRRFDPDARYGLRLTLFALALFLVAVPFGWLVEQVGANGWLVGVDTSAARHLHGWVGGSPVAVWALKVVSLLGTPVLFYVVVPMVSLALWRLHRPRMAVFLVVTASVGGLLDIAVKLAVNRGRPSLVDPVATASGYSFPSGHAMASTVVYGALLLVLLPLMARNRRVAAGAVAAMLVLAIGFSRLALGVHYISDVVGGFVLGAAWLVASAAAFRIWQTEREPGSWVNSPPSGILDAGEPLNETRASDGRGDSDATGTTLGTGSRLRVGGSGRRVRWGRE